MKIYFNLLCICCLIVGLLACTQKQAAHNELAPKVFEQQAETAQGTFLDVRTPGEYNEGHLPDAVNIDYKADDFEVAVGQLDKSKPYFVYCKSGVRSKKAADIMQKMGFTQIYNLDGGIDAWKAEGLPLQK